MGLFVGSFIVFTLVALALSVGILFRGQPMHASCRGLPADSNCSSDAFCSGACRREK
jgi:hypothetical protein